MTHVYDIEFQPQINIGMIGHVSDGKSTIVKAITGQSTQRYSQEKSSNLTIRLGYANAKIIQCSTCPEPECYSACSSDCHEYKCNKCEGVAILVNHVSFVDCPGHHSFMQTMLSGTSVMDYTILVESLANKTIPAAQTIAHLNSINSTEIENIMVILNKIDLVSKDKTIDSICTMRNFLSNYKAKTNPIIPISASLNINIDVLCAILAKLKPKQKTSMDFKMNIIRSFNVNKPGTNIDQLKGGVIGGSIQNGTVRINDSVYIVPGIVIEEDNTFKPIKAQVLSINSDSNKLNDAHAGGLIGLMLDIDPGLTGNDRLIGDAIIKDIDIGLVSKHIIILKNNIDINFDKNNLYICISSQTIKVIKAYEESSNIHLILEKSVYLNLNDSITLFTKEDELINFIGITAIVDSVNLLLSKL